MYLRIINKKFDELTLIELYQIMKIRSDVFLIEQNVKETDFDDFDFTATHHFIVKDEEIIAYARSYFSSEDIIKIGRVLVVENMRRKGYAYFLLENIIKNLISSTKYIEVSAQEYSKGLYLKLGFKAVGKTYVEAGIKHIKMIIEVK